MRILLLCAKYMFPVLLVCSLALAVCGPIVYGWSGREFSAMCRHIVVFGVLSVFARHAPQQYDLYLAAKRAKLRRHRA